jgi:hypothetical protein
MMRVTHVEVYRNDPQCEIRAGQSSWGDDDRSIKFAWFDKHGRVCRGGEVPAESVLQMLEVAIKQGDVTAKEVAQLLAKIL